MKQKFCKLCKTIVNQGRRYGCTITATQGKGEGPITQRHCPGDLEEVFWVSFSHETGESNRVESITYS